MTRPAVRLIMNEAIFERVYYDVCEHREVEIGGRWIGHVYLPGQQPKEAEIEISEEQTTDVIYGYLPTGPNPEKSTAVELLPDRNYQLWTIKQIQSVNEDMEVLGSWHSHIPNGLERYSQTDHHSYYSKLNNPTYPYPYDGLVCSLIHSMPDSEKEIKLKLEHAWFPIDGELGQHSWYLEGAIEWHQLTFPGEECIPLGDYTAYLEATGQRNMALDDWIHAIDYVAKSTGYDSHQIRKSPDGERILLLESFPNGIDYAVEIHRNNDAYFVIKSESETDRIHCDSIEDAMQHLQKHVIQISGLSARWSDVNRTLVLSLMRITETIPEKPSIGRFGALLRNLGFKS